LIVSQVVDWTSVLSVFGGSIALCGAAAWLTRSLIQHFLSKDLEKFRLELRTQHDVELERAKSDLQRLFREHEIRFSHLHEKRAEIIAELYQLTVETNDAAEACVETFKEKPDKRRFDLAKQAIDRGDKLAEFVIRNKIYFSKHLARELEELYTCLIDTGITYRMHCEALREGKDCADFAGSMSEVEVDTGGALKTIEEEFRSLLGVENPDNTTLPPNDTADRQLIPNR
jgi:hypothetical protein